jgi:hypothetical protein
VRSGKSSKQEESEYKSRMGEEAQPETEFYTYIKSITYRHENHAWNSNMRSNHEMQVWYS